MYRSDPVRRINQYYFGEKKMKKEEYQAPALEEMDSKLECQIVFGDETGSGINPGDKDDM